MIRLSISSLVPLLAVLTCVVSPRLSLGDEPAKQRLAGTVTHRDLAYVENGHPRQKLDLYLPDKKSDSPLPLIVWIHGGAWQAGSKDGCPALQFLTHDYAVASIDYRLSGDAIFPAQIEDCKSAIRWLRAHAGEYRIDPQRIGVWGASAGGHLVALLGTTGDIKEFDVGANLDQSSRVQAVCDFFGPTDLIAFVTRPNYEAHADANSPESKLIGGVVMEHQEKARRANPIPYITKNDPPFLIVHGDKDPIVPIEQSELLFAALRKAEVSVHFHNLHQAGHGGPGFNAKNIDDMVNAFFDTNLKGKPPADATPQALITESVAGMTEPVDVVRRRIVDKVQRVRQGAEKWHDDGKDPSEILAAMQEKVLPLLDKHMPVDAEAELDRLLEKLSDETKYLSFQLMTGIHGYSGPRPPAGRHSLSKEQLTEFVQDVVKSIGLTGDARHKLAFAVGPVCFDMTDEETRQFIADAFAVARENDVAVAFHIDDSMSWGERKGLMENPENLETADWKQIPNTGRRADWGRTPTRFPPQLCFNGPGVRAAVEARAAVIGNAISKELAVLKAQNKEFLFAGVMAGWETQIGRDFETGSSLGYRALSHRGFSEANSPKDADAERVQIVKEFIELWANHLHEAGVPKEKVFCHIAFTAQGLRAADARESHAAKMQFALPEVAFDPAYRPGFSTYPEGSTMKEIYAALAEHGTPGWISAEGVNVSPTGMPGEATMETYLAKMFNHGAVMTNIFSWGIGGPAMKENFFRKATENPEALAAYGKFLCDEALVESTAKGFSPEAFQDKMHKIQKDLPAWVTRTNRQAEMQPLTKNLAALLKEKRWKEADEAADQILSLMATEEKK